MVYPQEILESFNGGASLSGLTRSSTCLFLLQQLKKSNRDIFVTLNSEDEAFSFYSLCLDSNSEAFVYFPQKRTGDWVPGFGLDTRRFRKEAILQLSSEKRVCCIGTESSLFENLNREPIEKNIYKQTLRIGDECDRDELIEKLISFDYKKTPVVTDPGTFSSRGDILDLYPEHFRTPFRISFNYNTIESVSLFDPASQLTTKPQSKIVLEELKNPQVVDNINLMTSFSGCTNISITKKQGQLSISTGKTEELIELGCVDINTKKGGGPDKRINEVLRLGSGTRTWFFAGDKNKIMNTPLAKQGNLFFLGETIQTGFVSKKMDVVVVAENDIFYSYNHKTRWGFADKTTQQPVNRNSVSSMSVGEYIVHKGFGIGLYRGISRRGEGGKESVEIEYKNNTRVFVSLDQLSMLHKYIGSGKKPNLSTVGSKKWKTEIKKTRASVAEVVQGLLDLYSKRNNPREFSYVKENELEGEPSASFAFVETKDQKLAISDVLSDLDKSLPMNRLICGDVGFGKTEVAIRAIFKAFLSDRVCVFLCPTTILADQHYITCKERLGPMGVNVSLLSRFKTKKEQSLTIKQLKEGRTDVLIGTHRILSKDVEIPKLGLLVIDEEHRFGVKHKEQIRMLKDGVDVLAMTATPIPRTLQQSLVGLKDISTISTPPKSRRPIFTSIRYFDWELIFERIGNELSRGGQVYFLNNDIGTIPFIVEKIKRRFGDFIVAGASGKMATKDLESAVLGFFSGEVDVLVSTTIIESGLDVTNANTMIVNNAQNFGLSQLYQIRGRVGRGKRQASCLLLIPKMKLDEPAQKRLQALEKNTALGSGYNISMNDLEIRGAGSLFGHKQSGHISSIGFQMYCDLLNLELKKDKDGKNQQPVVKTTIPAEIEEQYIEDPSFRIDYYYRISCAKTLDEVSNIEKELVGVFGDVPPRTKHLLLFSRVRVLFTPTPATKIVVHDGFVEIYLEDLRDGLDSFLHSVALFAHDALLEIKLFPEGQSYLKIVLYMSGVNNLFSLLLSFVRLFDGGKLK